MKDPVSVAKAKNVLEKALSQDESYLPAVYFLAEIYEQEMNLEAAIELLERQVEIQPTCKLHQMLGDLWARVHNEEKALDHYAVALKLVKITCFSLRFFIDKNYFTCIEKILLKTHAFIDFLCKRQFFYKKHILDLNKKFLFWL